MLSFLDGNPKRMYDPRRQTEHGSSKSLLLCTYRTTSSWRESVHRWMQAVSVGSLCRQLL